MRFVIPYRVKTMLELPARVKNISPYDLESVVLDAPLQPRIALGSAAAGEALPSFGKTADGGGGLPHAGYGLAVKESVRGYEVCLRDSAEACEEVRTAGADGAFLAACYGGKHTSIYLETPAGLLRYEGIYRAKPVRASVGFQSASVVFDDGRSVILHQSGCSEVGLPVDALAFLEGVFYGRSSEWVVAVDVHSGDVKPCVKVGGAEFAGFLSGLPVFREGSSFYILDGGSLIKRGAAAGYVTAWGEETVDDEGERLVVMDAYGKPVADVPKDPSAACRASKYGIACFRGNLLGIMDFSSKSVVEINSRDSDGEHAVEVSADAGVSVVYKGSEYRVGGGRKVLIADEGVSVLRDHFFNLTVKHLLRDEDTYLRSPAKRVEVRVGKAELLTSSAMHECGGFGVLRLEGVEFEKPARVALEVAGKPLTKEVCVDGSGLEEVPVEAVDTLTGDRVEVSRLRPAIEYVVKLHVSISVKHEPGKSLVSVVSEDVLKEVRLCCNRACRDFPAGSSSAVFEMGECRLPAWVEVTTWRSGFLYCEKLNIEAPGLADAVIKAGSAGEFRLGGFYTTIPFPDYPDIPPIHKVRARILPNKLVVTLNSRTVGRGSSWLGAG